MARHAPVELPRFFLVGPRYGHHSTFSGFEGFRKFLNISSVPSPVKSRFLSHRLGTIWGLGDVGWRIDQLTALLTPRPLYSLGVLGIELSTAFHMLRRSRSLYHVLYGDTDVWLMNYLKKIGDHRVVATFHDSVPILEWLRIDKIASRLDAVILLSSVHVPYFRRFLPPERIFLVPHGVDTEFFCPAGPLTREPICLTVGSKLRDFKTFAGAIDRVLSVNPKVRFIAVGARRTDPNVPSLVHSHVEFVDGITDQQLLSLYRSARMGVFPLLDATANNALLEAMACGLPVVVTDVGGIRDYAGVGIGRLCKLGDPEDLAASILDLLEDKIEIPSRGAASRKQAEKFSFPLVAQQMRRAYESVFRL